MHHFHQKIVCAFLYTITRHGYPPPAKDTRTYLEDMVRLGFSTVELEGIRDDHLMQMYQLRHNLAKHQRDLNVKIPIYCTVLPALTSTDSALRTRQLELFRYGCETAATLGASFTLDNGPLPPYQFPDSIPITRHYEHQILADATLPAGFNWSDFYGQLIETYQQVCDIAAEYNLTYLIHPATGVLGSTPASFLQLADGINRPNLGFNFDTSNLISLRCNLELSWHQLAEYVPYIHISDNGGHQNEHLALGDGIINWHAFIKLIKSTGYDGYIGIDIGGEESLVPELDQAYQDAATWLQENYYLES